MSETKLPPELSDMAERAVRSLEAFAAAWTKIAIAYELAATFDFQVPITNETRTDDGSTGPTSSEGTEARKEAPKGDSNLLQAPLDFSVVKSAITAAFKEPTGRDDISRVLSMFGVKRAGDLPEEKYAEFVSALGTRA